MVEVVIVGATRTPFGKLGGALSGLSAIQLGACVIRSSLDRAGVPLDQVDSVVMGTVITAGLGQDLATGAPPARVLANRALFDRTELQQRGVVGI